MEETTGRALLTDLDVFAHRVFNNLFNAIYSHHKSDNIQAVELNECVHQTRLNEAHVNAHVESFVGREKLLGKFAKLIAENRFAHVASSSTEASRELIDQKNALIHVVLINGESGSGKTAFLCHFLKKTNPLRHSFVHCVGAYENSEHTLLFLKRFCVQTSVDYGLFGDDLSEQELNASYDDGFLRGTFAKILQKLSEKITNDKFYLIVDGVDMLVDESKRPDHSFSWLPEHMPARICLIFTACSSSHHVKAALSRKTVSNAAVEHRIKLDVFEIEPLDVLDKSEFIRLQLAKYGKHLDETSFNNQMKLLTTKRDSTHPLYLAWACDELRQFNQYETLNQKIKELPIKMNLLVEYTLKRLETTFGAKFTSAAFMFIGKVFKNDLPLNS